ncbi:hypothetical protein I0C86_40720 [Plantactinospora sp. S1510]|uniref:Uncharacterized protein n=1 Tax=Plantactinospora alkalitolerans TaxID=2789879 RepID=A0ABS0H9R0_9ACTN|nr:hypothetical protein [Plantactinospora alkalitolerans]MBF9135205.1 hypothetical protein [Plantactinospora alkalitolerans]
MEFRFLGDASLVGRFSLTLADLTPSTRPAELTDNLWGRIEQCVSSNPDFDATEVHEALAGSGVQVTIPTVLYALANRAQDQP